MSINNVQSTITISNQLQLNAAQLDMRLAPNEGIIGTIGGMALWSSYQQLQTNISVNASQFKNLANTPVLMISAPGASSIISIDDVMIYTTYLGVDYTSGSNVVLQYGNAPYSAINIASSSLAALLFTGISEDSVLRVSGNMTNYLPAPYNQPIYLTVTGVDYLDGNSIFSLTIRYKVYTP